MSEKNSTSVLYRLLNETDDIFTFLDNYDDELAPLSFHELLNTLLAKNGLQIPSVIKASNINETSCYQIFNGRRKPSRDKIIQLCFGMALTPTEANRLLKVGEKSELYCRDKRDAVFIYGLNNKLAVVDIDEILFSYGLDTLTSSV